MSSSLIIRPGWDQDLAQMARVHVRCWQETYRGLMPDAVLDDPGFPAARERMWSRALTDERYRENRVAESAVLWVADPNPRAQAFYRKHGFVPDGTAQAEDSMREIRMVRVSGSRGIRTSPGQHPVG